MLNVAWETRVVDIENVVDVVSTMLPRNEELVLGVKHVHKGRGEADGDSAREDAVVRVVDRDGARVGDRRDGGGVLTPVEKFLQNVRKYVQKVSPLSMYKM